MAYIASSGLHDAMYRNMTQLKSLASAIDKQVKVLVEIEAESVEVLDVITGESVKALSKTTGKPIKARGHVVTMSNALTRASHGLSLSEKRIIMMSISQMDSRKKRPDQSLIDSSPTGPISTIYATDYAEQYGLHLTTAYEQLADSAKTLFERKITFYAESHTRNGKDIEVTKRQMRWVGGVQYSDGSVSLEWHWGVVPHLTGLKAQFTTYQLEQASALRSVYSWKLLELLMRFKKNGWAEYSVGDFSESMGATEKQRENFNNIRRRIIEPAVKELTEKDGWIIEWKPIKKKGRRVERLRFEFRKDEQLKLDV